MHLSTRNPHIHAQKVFRANREHRVHHAALLMTAIVFATLIAGVAGLGTIA